MFGVVSGHDPIGDERGSEENSHEEAQARRVAPLDDRKVMGVARRACRTALEEWRGAGARRVHACTHLPRQEEGAGGDSNDRAESLETPPARENARHRQRSMGCLAGRRRGEAHGQSKRHGAGWRCACQTAWGCPGPPNMGSRCPTREGRLTRMWGSHPTSFQPPLVLAEGPARDVCRHLRSDGDLARGRQGTRRRVGTRAGRIMHRSVVGRSDAPSAKAFARSS